MNQNDVSTKKLKRAKGVHIIGHLEAFDSIALNIATHLPSARTAACSVLLLGKV